MQQEHNYATTSNPHSALSTHLPLQVVPVKVTATCKITSQHGGITLACTTQLRLSRKQVVARAGRCCYTNDTCGCMEKAATADQLLLMCLKTAQQHAWAANVSHTTHLL
jgi:hypothetical protein